MWGSPGERYVRQPAWVEWPTCPYHYNNHVYMIGGWPAKTRCPVCQTTPSARAKFCHVKVSSGVTEDAFELTCFVNCLMRRFCISLKVTIKSDNAERLQQEQQVREENRQNTWFAQSLFFYELSDHSTIFRKCTSDGGVVRLHVNLGDLFLPRLRRFPHEPGVNHLHVHRPSMSFPFTLQLQIIVWFSVFRIFWVMTQEKLQNC